MSELETAITAYLVVRNACQVEYDRLKNTDPHNAHQVWKPEHPADQKSNHSADHSADHAAPADHGHQQPDQAAPAPAAPVAH